MNGAIRMNVAAIKAFLKSRNAVSVHFSTVMTRRQDLLFPDDLKNAISLAGVALSFSTIQPGDTHRLTGKGGAEGSIGMLVDLGPNTVVESVAADDSGSIWDPEAGLSGSLGYAPTPQTCAESIDKRTESNEWVIRDFVPRGIFILEPILVQRKLVIEGIEDVGEVQISFQDAIGHFVGQRVFSADKDAFREWDRKNNEWKQISYQEIFLELPMGGTTT
jgi:hypothetical protein